MAVTERSESPARRIATVFTAALKLGLTSFGGPIAHLAYFHNEYVTRRGWIDERSYTDLVALCQLLPGPASSQVGMAIGMQRSGIAGGIASWLGFTLPSAALMTAFALLLHGSGGFGAGLIHGLLIVAVAVVGSAVISMARTQAAGPLRAVIAACSLAVMLLAPSPLTQIGVLLFGAAAGALFMRSTSSDPPSEFRVPIGRAPAMISLLLFVLLLGLLPVAATLSGVRTLAVIDSFYRSGALVFGGGHVVLPLLEQLVVGPGWMGQTQFLAGYAAAQAVPGPLFSFSAYLGASMNASPSGVTGAAIALLSIYLPSFLLLIGALPLWATIRRHPSVRAVVGGIGPAVVGLLAAALYTPVFTAAIHSPADLALAGAAFALLVGVKAPAWLIVIGGAAGGIFLRALGLSH